MAAFTTKVNSQKQIFAKILDAMGYNSVQDLIENCAMSAGAPDQVSQTGTIGRHLVYDSSTGDVYIKTALTAASYTYAKIVDVDVD